MTPAVKPADKATTEALIEAAQLASAIEPADAYAAIEVIERLKD